MYFWHIDCSYRKQTAINKEDHGASAETRSRPVINVNIPITVLVIALLLLISGVTVLREYERAVVFRLGRVVPYQGPGLVYVIPLIERMVRVSLRTITLDVPPQNVVTHDNVSLKVSAVLYFRVLDPGKALIEVANYLFVTSQLAQTSLRSVCGQAEFDDLLTERDKINAHLQEILDAQTEPWGIKVSLVELKHIDLPQDMHRALAKQAEAERERRAKVINAEGEFQAAQRLAEAARLIEQHPVALQLRYLQTLGQIATENPSTTLFPVPIDFLSPFLPAKKTT
jgi:regulator of protease activity HflC (stomatin/prohibitin superfamily)